MKRFAALTAILLFVGITLAFAADNRPAAPPAPPRTPEMSTAGKVVEVSDALLKIERTLKGSAEIMEFILEKPFPNIAAGDQIKVSYRVKDGRNILIRVAPAPKTAVQKPGKQEAKKTGGTPPAAK
jgi:hypothetical protein